MGVQRRERSGGLSDSRDIAACVELELALLEGCSRLGYMSRRRKKECVRTWR